MNACMHQCWCIMFSIFGCAHYKHADYLQGVCLFISVNVIVHDFVHVLICVLVCI